MNDSHSAPRRRFTLSARARRRLAWALAAIVAVAVIGAVVIRSTPWPSAMLIRAVFEQGGAATVEEMIPYVPATRYDERLDIQYSDGTAGDDTTLDVVSPAGNDPLPTIVWIHGGAWISGDKTDVDPYLRILAHEGYTTVSLDYTRGPEAVYPTAVVQLNEALAYLDANADDLRIDRERLILAGDSAGANLASQLATLTTNPAYAELLDIEPALDAEQVIGTVLNCGVYDLDTMDDLTGISHWGFQIALWAYTGTRDWSVSAQGTTMSTIDFVDESFPPTYISGGNGDGLTWIQSVPMANTLATAGVDVTTLFWPMDHSPALPHEYQFQLDDDEAHVALRETVEFLERVTSESR